MFKVKISSLNCPPFSLQAIIFIIFFILFLYYLFYFIQLSCVSFSILVTWFQFSKVSISQLLTPTYSRIHIYIYASNVISDGILDVKYKSNVLIRDRRSRGSLESERESVIISMLFQGSILSIDFPLYGVSWKWRSNLSAIFPIIASLFDDVYPSYDFTISLFSSIINYRVFRKSIVRIRNYIKF